MYVWGGVGCLRSVAPSPFSRRCLNMLDGASEGADPTKQLVIDGEQHASRTHFDNRIREQTATCAVNDRLAIHVHGTCSQGARHTQQITALERSPLDGV